MSPSPKICAQSDPPPLKSADFDQYLNISYCFDLLCLLSAVVTTTTTTTTVCHTVAMSVYKNCVSEKLTETSGLFCQKTMIFFENLLATSQNIQVVQQIECGC